MNNPEGEQPKKREEPQPKTTTSAAGAAGVANDGKKKDGKKKASITVNKTTTDLDTLDTSHSTDAEMGSSDLCYENHSNNEGLNTSTSSVLLQTLNIQDDIIESSKELSQLAITAKKRQPSKKLKTPSPNKEAAGLVTNLVNDSNENQLGNIGTALGNILQDSPTFQNLSALLWKEDTNKIPMKECKEP